MIETEKNGQAVQTDSNGLGRKTERCLFGQEMELLK